ncbi:MAG: hypothetical protein IBX50_10185 [Marinospirillum sp.]|uniref:hypothetical protein n=1 Tax=Marinospirillum sp. TaxID=2183934 RepID=UPI0019F4B01C|nr:hypothetical protein [Marinospirillum sp.]MBE0507071.1 hypothetical protein [Marinospirillum sp.]
MSAFWWILLSVVLVLSPMSMLKPTARQKRLILLRDTARQLGIKVTLTPQLLEPGLKLEGAAYRWLRAADASPMPGYLCLMRKEPERERGGLWQAGWELVKGRRSFLTEEQQKFLSSWLETLPEDVFAVEWGSATLAIWWHERADSVILEKIHTGALALLALNSQPFVAVARA